jgi:putative exporter of polyketide antibiotics
VKGGLMSHSAKLLTVSLVGIMLSIGLCSAGGGFDTHVTNLQIGMTYLGGFLFVASMVFLVIGLTPKTGGGNK